MADYNGVKIRRYTVRNVEYVGLWWYIGQGSKRDVEALGPAKDWTKAKQNRARLSKEKELALHPGRVGAGEAPTLRSWCDRYLQMRSELASASIKEIQSTIAYLIDHFGEPRKIDGITRVDAARFREYLGGLPGRDGAMMSEARVCLHMRNASTLMGVKHGALKYDLIPFNPFDREKTTTKTAKKGYPSLTEEQMSALLDACPDSGWRAMVALCVYAGVRSGESRLMRWSDVQWGKGRIRVPNEKTGRQADGTYTKRDCLLEPRLESVLLECYESASGDLVADVSRHNLHRKMVKVVELAGLEPWRDPFHALRRMRESYWMAEHPASYVHDWLGHSGAVSQESYASTPESYFTQASEATTKLKRAIDKLTPAQVDQVHAYVEEISQKNGATSAQHPGAPRSGQ